MQFDTIILYKYYEYGNAVALCLGFLAFSFFGNAVVLCLGLLLLSLLFLMEDDEMKEHIIKTDWVPLVRNHYRPQRHTIGIFLWVSVTVIAAVLYFFLPIGEKIPFVVPFFSGVDITTFLGKHAVVPIPPEKYMLTGFAVSTLLLLLSFFLFNKMTERIQQGYISVSVSFISLLAMVYLTAGMYFNESQWFGENINGLVGITFGNIALPSILLLLYIHVLLTLKFTLVFRRRCRFINNLATVSKNTNLRFEELNLTLQQECDKMWSHSKWKDYKRYLILSVFKLAETEHLLNESGEIIKKKTKLFFKQRGEFKLGKEKLFKEIFEFNRDYGVARRDGNVKTPPSQPLTSSGKERKTPVFTEEEIQQEQQPKISPSGKERKTPVFTEEIQQEQQPKISPKPQKVKNERAVVLSTPPPSQKPQKVPAQQAKTNDRSSLKNWSL